ncbi:MAG: DEAD/DEAH box helicase family protein, partial [Romboutsia sp.]|nr:DEAD/DEAH box helicase family protein [Romboutsia sp.]
MYNIFKDYIDETTNNKYTQDNTSLTNSVIWNKLYKFQKDGVLGALEKLEKYNGCIIADSVGLGKTFEALAIIKYYESINARVLVLCPKKLRDNWIMYKGNDVRNILSEDRLRYDVLNHTDLTRKSGFSGDINLKTFNWSNYDLVVIDESHNFRNGGSRNSNNRYDKLMNDIIKMGIPTKVLLLSATPVNNQLNDLKHQINLITEENDKHIEHEGIRSINFTLKSTQQAFNEWSKLPEDQRSLNEFLDLINYDYFKLLDIFTIARSRKHIEKYYTTNDIGKFPNRKKPITIKSKIDTPNKFPSISEIAKQISMLNLSAYSPIEYILPECLYKYKKYDFLDLDKNLSLKQSDREKGLLKLIRTNLLKRLESSIYSLQLTLERTLFRIDETINGLTESKEKFILNLEINERDIDLEDDSDEYIRKNSMEINFKDIDIDRWINDLQEDKLVIQKLLSETNQINASRDAKLKELKELLEHKIKNPINDGNKKVIVFTAFADTAKYLYENLEEWLISNYGIRSGLIIGSGNNETNRTNTKNDINEILMHFSPISKSRDSIQPESSLEIDVLIATDCISEGQNLQDC